MTCAVTPLSTIAERPLALTLGEPAGIGPEITLKAWIARKQQALPAFFVTAPPDILARSAEGLALDVPLQVIDGKNAAEAALAAFDHALPILPIEGNSDFAPGAPDPRTGETVIRSITAAVEAVERGDAAAVVTNPIQKSVLYDAGFRHPGHTEFLAALCTREGVTPTPVMMLAIEGLRVVPLTVHLPLREVPGRLSVDLIMELAEITAAALTRDFGVEAPRIAIAGLNPHAGEDGRMGDEEQRIITPAIERLRAAGIDARGPYPADTMFHAAARARYDAALCTYHDQALIPLKTLDFDRGVNVTLGLPIVRSSPDHGTATDIAGRGIARPDSLIAAIRMAGTIARNRASRNPS